MTAHPEPGAPRGNGQVTDRLFAGPGEVRALCRALDWSATPLGPVDRWPASLRAVVGLVLAAPVGMIVLWGPHLVQVYNDAYRLVMGAKHPAGLGQPTRDCWPEVWPFNAPLYEAILERGDAFAFEDQRLVIERHGAPEEAFFTLSYSGVPDDHGAVGGVLVTVVETTGHVHGRRAEAERVRFATAHEAERTQVLEEVFRQAPSFLAVYHGPAHVYALANAAYYQLIGHGREIIGRPLLEALPEVEGQGFDVLLDRVLQTGEPFVAREIPVRLERTPGAPPEDRVVALTYLPLVDVAGARAGVIAHGTDVTEYVLARREVERLLAESDATRRAELEVANQQLQTQAAALVERTEAAEAARADAEVANRAKGEFLAVMSHELRTPLNAIGGYAELIELGIHGPVTPEQRAALARIQNSQRHLLGLVNGVLNYARLEAGAVHYELADVPLTDVLPTCEGLIAPQVRARGLTLQHSDCAADTRVRADREKLQQIVLNLLGNAVKFTEPGGRIELRSEVVHPDGAAAGATVRVQVADTGVGIPADHLARVFEPFVQVDARLTRAKEGAGLGLAISRDLARGMGGDLTAESTPGVGSTFTLTLPAA